MPSHSTHMHHHKRPTRVGPNTNKNTIFLKKVGPWRLRRSDLLRILSQTNEENSAFSSDLWEHDSLRSDLVNSFMLKGPRLGDVEDIAEGVSRLCEILQVLGEDFDHSDGSRLDEHSRVVNIWTKLCLHSCKLNTHLDKARSVALPTRP